MIDYKIRKDEKMFYSIISKAIAQAKKNRVTITTHKKVGWIQFRYSYINSVYGTNDGGCFHIKDDNPSRVA